MKKHHITKKQRIKIYFILISVITLVSILGSFIGTFATYPTERHRATVQSITKLEQQSFSEQDRKKADAIIQSSQYMDLKNSSENRYSEVVSIGVFIASIVSFIVITVLLYNYLRKIRLTAKVVRAIVLIYLAESVITYIPALYLHGLVTGSKPFSDPFTTFLTIVGLPFALMISCFIVYVLAKIIDILYNQRHGFIDE